jgi:hypothetical protein
MKYAAFQMKKKKRLCSMSQKMQLVYWLTKYMKYTNFVVAVLVSYIYRMGTV